MPKNRRLDEVLGTVLGGQARCGNAEALLVFVAHAAEVLAGTQLNAKNAMDAVHRQEDQVHVGERTSNQLGTSGLKRGCIPGIGIPNECADRPSRLERPAATEPPCSPVAPKTRIGFLLLVVIALSS